MGFDGLFAPIATRIEIVRPLAALAPQDGWEMYNIYFKSALLNAELLEDIYMHQLRGAQSCKIEKRGSKNRTFGLCRTSEGEEVVELGRRRP